MEFNDTVSRKITLMLTHEQLQMKPNGMIIGHVCLIRWQDVSDRELHWRLTDYGLAIKTRQLLYGMEITLESHAI